MTKKTKFNAKNLFTGMSLGVARPLIIKVLLASVASAGLVGIISLLSGEFGEIQGKILFTVILTSGFSIGTLIYLTAAGRYQIVAIFGVIAAIISFCLGLCLVWMEWNFFESNFEYIFKNYIFSTIVAIAIAHSCLIVRLLEHKVMLIRIGAGITIGNVIVLTGLIGYMIYGKVEDPEVLLRLMGVIGILVAVGTIVTPVWARTQKK